MYNIYDNSFDPNTYLKKICQPNDVYTPFVVLLPVSSDVDSLTRKARVEKFPFLSFKLKTQRGMEIEPRRPAHKPYGQKPKIVGFHLKWNDNDNV